MFHVFIFYFNPDRLLLYYITHLDLKLSSLISMFEWQNPYEMTSLHPPSVEISNQKIGWLGFEINMLDPSYHKRHISTHFSSFVASVQQVNNKYGYTCLLLQEGFSKNYFKRNIVQVWLKIAELKFHRFGHSNASQRLGSQFQAHTASAQMMRKLNRKVAISHL